MTAMRWTLGGLFVVAFLFSLLVTLPASLLGAGIRSASQGRLELANCEGTVWHGSAVPILHRHSPDQGILPLSPLQWDVSITSLFTLQPRIALNWPDANQTRPTELRLAARQLIVNDLYLSLPASLLGELSPYLRPVGLGGRIIVKSDSLRITNHQLQGTLVADWIGAHSALSDLSPLGDYHFVLKGSGAGGDLSLDTTSGMLILKGSGHLDAAGSVNFSGHAQAAEGQQKRLGELLQHLGPEVAPGQHAFSLVTN